MSRKTTVTTSSVTPAKASVKPPAKSRTTSTKTATKTAPKAEPKPRGKRQPPAQVVEEVPEEEIEEEEDDVSETETQATPATPSETKKRFVPTKESVIESFDEIVELIEEEINRLRTSETKTKGVKFLRTLNKRVKTLRGQTNRVMKQKQKTNRKKNSENSGFLKPVPVTAEIAKFAGWDPEELHSRVDVTKCICEYIKKNELQNPNDRRQINPDVKLQRLLNYKPGETLDKDGNPQTLKYYNLQTYMTRLFPKKEDSEE